MNRRSRPLLRSPNSSPESFHRYLKPGALAQIRNNSRMIARFNRVNPVSQIYSPPIAPINSGGLLQLNIVESSPCFAGRVYSPISLKRKKLLAAKSCFLSSTPASLTPDSPPDAVVEA